MRLPWLPLMVLAACPVTAFACREPSQDVQFKDADTVLVGWISSASAPELETLAPGSTDTGAFNQSINSGRVLRIIVTETRKGRSVAQQTVEVSRCTGAYNNVGFRVIAYHFADGSWRVSQLPFQDSGSGP
jgi:hypothetical protein